MAIEKGPVFRHSAMIGASFFQCARGAHRAAAATVWGDHFVALHVFQRLFVPADMIKGPGEIRFENIGEGGVVLLAERRQTPIRSLDHAFPRRKASPIGRSALPASFGAISIGRFGLLYAPVEVPGVQSIELRHNDVMVIREPPRLALGLVRFIGVFPGKSELLVAVGERRLSALWTKAKAISRLSAGDPGNRAKPSSATCRARAKLVACVCGGNTHAPLGSNQSR